MAPPTPAAGAFPISHGISTGEPRLSAAMLSPRLVSTLRPLAGRDTAGLDSAVTELSSWVEGSFRDWKQTAQVVGVMGRGPIPSYAPPYVPVGPVVMGDNISAGQVIAGPRFGRVI
jgi:hypothetical protein